MDTNLRRSSFAVLVWACAASGSFGCKSDAKSSQSDAGPVACSASLTTIASTSEVVYTSADVLPCGNEDSATVDCVVIKATIKIGSGRGPVDASAATDGIGDQPILLVVRSPKGTDGLCGKPWVVFDAGGLGGGYGSQFGGVPPGHYVAGNQYGDDLIRDLNVAGYVTVDMIIHCPISSGGPCEGQPYAGWADSNAASGQATAWFNRTNGTGYLGASARNRAVYEWVKKSSGDRSICAHAQSSGSGRLVGVVTRFDPTLFRSVIFSGGPVFAYVPWMCSLDTGPMGTRPSFYQGDVGTLIRSTFDCARGKTSDCSDFFACRTQDGGPRYNPVMLPDSHFYSATSRQLGSMAVSVVMGGSDNSDAWQHLQLWLGGYTPTGASRLEPIAATQGIRMVQGYCANQSSSWTSPVGTRSCADWAPSTLVAVDAGSVADTYDSRLVGVPHEVPTTLGGKDVLYALTLASCLP